MVKTAAVGYAVAGLVLIGWAAASRDYLPMGLMLIVGIAALLHLLGPGTGADDQHTSEQTKTRYGVNAPDRPAGV